MEKFVEAAEKKHGEFGEKAARFLVEGSIFKQRCWKKKYTL